MKRRGISVFAGLASAGALALTGLVGTQAVVGAETVESIDHMMEVNESSLTESGDMGMVGTVEDMDSFHDVLFRKDGSWLGAGTLYTTTKLKGLDAEVFFETQSGWNGSSISSDTFPNTLELKDPNHEIYDMHVYVNIGGKIIHAGRLQTDFTHPIKIKDGVIYACNEKSFETYLVSKDGSLIHKDYVDDDLWGYTNDTNDEKNKVDFKGGEKEYQALWNEYESASNIKFEMLEIPLAENASSLTLSGDLKSTGKKSFYNSFQNCIDLLESQRCRYAKVKVAGYDGDVLAVQPINEPRCVYFFTDTGDEVLRVPGFLYTDGTYPVKIKDGVIYACNKNSFETYMITPDGKELVHKDYVNSSNWGYTNDSTDQSKRADYKGSFNDSKLWDAYNSASEINFNLTSWE